MLQKNKISLLPRKTYDRDALTLGSLNIKSRQILSEVEVLKRLTHTFSKLAAAFVILLTVTYLSLSNIFIKTVHAQELTQFVLPHIGYISTYFSLYHPGIDLAANLGTSVHPIASGVVEEIFYDRFDYGNHVLIDHPDGYKSLYGHLGKIFVKKGQAVDLNTVLGQVGLTGRSTGPHTHLEITKDGNYLDPLKFLPKSLQLPTLLSAISVGGPLPQPTIKEEKLSKSLKPDFSF